MSDYIYPDSWKYGRRHFDAGAAAYLEGHGLIVASEAAGFASKTTLLHFLRINGLLRPPGAATESVRAYWLARRRERLATVHRFKGRRMRDVAAAQSAIA